ncbi:MAG: hypothetical protein EOO07_15745 [Chitinophagaceae bacterium]|nr:MAG: hypothetical protein EOO07_15745 [Chitinophagaceae bacterium]
MFLRKYCTLIVIAFMAIFATKMVISGAPVVFSSIDKKLMRAVIMQLEVENNSEETSKGNVKFADHKLMFQRFDVLYVPLVISNGLSNSFIDHSRRYVDPYHPLVPTPPPNFS